MDGFNSFSENQPAYELHNINQVCTLSVHNEAYEIVFQNQIRLHSDFFFVRSLVFSTENDRKGR